MPAAAVGLAVAGPFEPNEERGVGFALAVALLAAAARASICCGGIKHKPKMLSAL